MNQPIPFIRLPPVDTLEVPEKLNVWARNMNRTLDEHHQRVVTQINSQVQGVGLTLISASTVKPLHPIHKVSGTASIQTIVAPTGFTGPLFLIPTAGWAWVTGGNIALSGTAVAGKLLVMVYDGALWYPSYT